MKVAGGYYTGGILGFSHGAVKKCMNYATVEGKNEDNAFAGGIVGYYLSEREIEKCINYGTIYGRRIIGGIYARGYGRIFECCNMGQVASEGKLLEQDEEDIQLGDGLGGIVGDTESEITNCYNAGNIIAESDDFYNAYEEVRRYVGGIVGCGGGATFSLEMQNVYSVGQVKNGWPGAITSVLFSLDNDDFGKLSNCFWLSGVADVGVHEVRWRVDPDFREPDFSSVYEYSQLQMKDQAFVNELNQNSISAGYGEVWGADTRHVNNGYPILKNVPYKISDLTQNVADDYNNEPGDADNDEPTDATPVSHFYEDQNYNTVATNSTIRIFANGGIVTVPGTTEKRNYKRCILYTDITPSYIYTLGKNGIVKPAIGKVVVGITSSNEKPSLVKGKIVDKSVSKMATASIRHGQITVTAKSQSGKAYLWAIDTGREAKAACIPVTVKAAPTATNIYAVSDTDPTFLYGKTKQFKNGKINVGESVKVYLYPTFRENGVVKRVKNVSYSASVAAKAADYFSVVQSANDPFCFEICAKGLKDGKSIMGNITFKCNLNGKKAVFKAKATNQVIDISTANVSGMTKQSDSSFMIKASDSAKITGTFELQTVCASDADKMTDSLKIYAMGRADGYDMSGLSGKVKIKRKRSVAQSKINMKPANDKKTIVVTVNKGAKPVTAYFLVVYNTVYSGAKKGYTVLSITAE